MLKRRVEAVERRLAGLGGATKKNFRIVYQFDGDPEPEEGPNEKLLVVQVVNTRGEKAEAQEREKDGPIVFKMPRPSPPKGERVARFDFGDGNRAGLPNEKTNDAAENSHPTETEKTRK